MLHAFLSQNRLELIERCRSKVRERSSPQAGSGELQFGIPLFLDQVITTLEMEQAPEPALSLKMSGSAAGGKSNSSEIGNSAAQHGRELLQQGFTVDQVVHDYGDICQSVTDLAFERGEPFTTDEFRTLNRCLDNAIADAVTEFNYQHDLILADDEANLLNKRLGFFAHEVRNLLNSAMLAVTALKAGRVGISGATGAVLDSSLVGLRNLIDRSLTEVRMAAGMPAHRRLFSLSHFIEEVRLSASLQAVMEDCHLDVAKVDPHLALDADRDLLLSAVGNLLQNAFKFTHRKTEVSLSAYASADRILIDVEDHCGGLPPGDAEKMFLPFSQNSQNKTGLGLGLSIARSSVETSDGILSVSDRPGSGCVFRIDLPRFAMPDSFTLLRSRSAA